MLQRKCMDSWAQEIWHEIWIIWSMCPCYTKYCLNFLMPTKKMKKRPVTGKSRIIEICFFLYFIICFSNWTNRNRCFMLKDEKYLDLENHPLFSISYEEDQWIDAANRWKWKEIRQLNHGKTELAVSEVLPFMIGIYMFSHMQI